MSRMEYWRQWALANKDRIKNQPSNHPKYPGRRWTSLKNLNRIRAKRENSRSLLEISKEDFLNWAADLNNQRCFYCGDLDLGRGSGVDRLDSTKPYTQDNIVACCKLCNQAKGELTVDAFKQHITRLYEAFQRKVS